MDAVFVFRGARLITIEDGEVTFARWQFAGLGKQAGPAWLFDVDLTPERTVDQAGQPTKDKTSKRGKHVGRVRFEGQRAELCLVRAGKDRTRPVLDRTPQENDVRCYLLTRVTTTAALDQERKACMASCMQRNMARAVSAQQIEAGCRSSCDNTTTSKGR
jgi:hypothetical protein